MTINVGHFFKTQMQYCANCHHITAGEALFCSRCGRSYNVRLCPRLHANPREALVCSQCGSQELSVPAPHTGILRTLIHSLIDLLPRSLPWIAGMLLVIAAVHALLTSPDVVQLLIATMLVWGVLWYAIGYLPSRVRKGLASVVQRLFGLKRNGHHGH